MSAPSPATIVYCDRAPHYVDGLTPERVTADLVDAGTRGHAWIVLPTQYGPTTLRLDAVTTIREPTDRERADYARRLDAPGRRPSGDLVTRELRTIDGTTVRHTSEIPGGLQSQAA